jgi:glycosyltransferase involved in cell wall biosynthesis
MICVDARLISAPGIGTYLKNILRELQSAPWKWCALVHPEHVDKLDAIEPIIISSKIYSLKEQLELPLKIPKVDLFWSPHFNIPCLPVRSRRRLVNIHDVFHLAHAAQFKFRERFCARTILKRALSLSNAVITGSQFSKGEIQRYLKTKKEISVIYHGCASSFSPHADACSAAILEKYRITNPFLLYVGSFKAHKNIRAAISAFALLKERGWKSLQFVIVGSSAGMRQCDDVKQLCIAHAIQCLENVPDAELPSFYRHAALFVFPSLYEGFGLPPLEAMASGCPAVVSRAGALPEVCQEGAVYIDPHSPSSIADAIEEMLQNEEKRKELRQRALARARQFSWKRSAEEHYSLIEGLLR